MRITLLFLLSSFLLAGQSIKGTIIDSKTNQSIESATVYYKKQQVGTLSNKKGKFTVVTNLKINKSDTLQFSIVGYAIKKITIAALSKAYNTVYLTKKIEQLDNVFINSENTLNLSLRFSKLASLPLSVFAFGSSLIDNKIYVFGGDASQLEDSAQRTFDEVSMIPNATFADFLNRSRYNFSWENYSSVLQVYNIDDNTWSQSDLKLKQRAYHAVNLYKNTFYVMGGKGLSHSRKFEYLDNTIELYNFKTDQLFIDYTNPHQAINFASCVYQDNIIVMGGSTKLTTQGEKVYTDAAHIYNLTSGNWFELPEMISPKETNGVLAGSKIFVIGGFNKTALNTIESYDLATATWHKEGTLFYGLENPALAHHGNIIYIFNDTKLLTYNTKSNVLDEYNINIRLKHSKLHYSNNKLYLIGGYSEDEFSKTASSNVYEIDLNEFEKTKVYNSKKMN
jgi:hypothetical protein